MKIILCGACGRMGKHVADASSERGATIVAGVDVVEGVTSFPLYRSLQEVKEQADVVIDFSSANGISERLAFCEQRKLPLVLAATGFTSEDLGLIHSAASEIPLFRTGNFSLGINLLQMLVKKAASVLGEDYDIEIIERHHHFKKDAPSGTALMLAESANEGRDGAMQNVCGRQGMIGERDKGEIGIHAVRGGTIVGEHEVMFAGEDEIVTLSHSARSRKVFAVGALKAAQWLIAQPAGTYDMNNLLSELIK